MSKLVFFFSQAHPALIACFLLPIWLKLIVLVLLLCDVENACAGLSSLTAFSVPSTSLVASFIAPNIFISDFHQARVRKRFLETSILLFDARTGPLLSPLNELSMESKLSRINSMRPVPLSFTPHALKADGVHDDSDITACLWSDERDLPWISEWSDFWKGALTDRQSHLSRACSD